MTKRLSYIVAVALSLIILQGCTIGYEYMTVEKKTSKVVFKGFYLEHGLGIMGVHRNIDSISFIPSILVRYMNKVRDTLALDTIGVVYIDSLCYHFTTSKDSVCPIPKWTSNSLHENYFRGNEDIYGPWWWWRVIKIPASETLLDASFWAVLRHPKTGKELARQRFTVRLKRFNDNRFVITE